MYSVAWDEVLLQPRYCLLMVLFVAFTESSVRWLPAMCCHERPFHVPSRDADCLISSFWRRSWWSCWGISLRPNNTLLPGRSCSCPHASTDAISTTGTLSDAVSRGHFHAASIVRWDIPVQRQTKKEQKGEETS